MSGPTSVEQSGLEQILERMAGLRAMVVGDLLLDEYRSGEVDRVSPEAPVPIVRVERVTRALGGAGNVARNVVSLGARCALHGVVGADSEGRALGRLVDDLGIDPDGVVSVPDRPTPHKLRVVARGQQMLRLDREEDAPIDVEVAARLREAIVEGLETADVMLLVDYDKGLFASLDARRLIEAARSRRVGPLPVIADPKRELARFRGASVVKPNLQEALRFVPGPAASASDRFGLCEKLRDGLGGEEVVVTRGRDGMSALDREGRYVEVATRPLEVYDVQGAGDTALAALALARAAGATLVEACIVANTAAAVVVEKFGTAAVEPAELAERLPDAIEAFVRGGRDAGLRRDPSDARVSGEGNSTMGSEPSQGES